MAYGEPRFNKTRKQISYVVSAWPTEFSGVFGTKALAVKNAKLAAKELNEAIAVLGPDGEFWITKSGEQACTKSKPA